MSFAPSVRPALRTAFVCAVLFAGTMLLFDRATAYGFINYDDPAYLTNNAAVQAGLTWPSVVWAFTAATDYWHPLTWLAHMLDWQLYGASAAGHHITSHLWHAANAVLAFFLFRRLAGGFWLSAFAAALFAWHPLRVESVVWITERKDVMSGCFFLLTLLAYTRYADYRRTQRPWRLAYGLTLLAFVAGLMSKPMLVTLPVVLLILDFWPLRRGSTPATWRPLVIEKLPFFVLSGATAALTILMQRHHGAFVLDLPFGTRAANAVVSLARYLGKFLWPSDLIVCYSHPGLWPLPVVLASAALASAVSWAAWRQRRARPWLLAGWLWFLVVLLPVIGLVQVGFQAMADRYTYLSLVGVEFALLWNLPPFLRSPTARRAAALAAGLVLAACAVRTWEQQGVWRDSETLFRHAIAASPDNDIAEDFLGYTLLTQGRFEEAEVHAERARTLNPRNATALYTLANVRERQGRLPEAMDFYRAFLTRQPRHAEARFHLGLLELSQGNPAEARAQMIAALRSAPLLRDRCLQLGLTALQHRDFPGALLFHEILLEAAPDDPRAHFGAAVAAEALGRTDDALAHYQAVVQRQPAAAEAHAAIGAILLARDDAAAALPHLRLAVEHNSRLAAAQLALAQCAEKLGHTEERDAALERATALAPDDPAFLTRAAEMQARRHDFAAAAGLYQRVVQFAPQDSSAHAALGYMRVLSGDRAGGVAAWERALELRPDFPGLRERLAQLRQP